MGESMEISTALPLRTICDFMSQDPKTHLNYYGKCSNHPENKKRIE